MYYSINFYQHKIFYDFFDDKIVDRFFNSVQGSFESVRGKEFNMQGYFELKHYHQTKIIELENTRVWLTNVFVGRYFNEFIRGEMKREILKRVIINGSKAAVGCLNVLINSRLLSLTRAHIKIFYQVNFF